MCVHQCDRAVCLLVCSCQYVRAFTRCNTQKLRLKQECVRAGWDLWSIADTVQLFRLLLMTMIVMVFLFYKFVVLNAISNFILFITVSDRFWLFCRSVFNSVMYCSTCGISFGPLVLILVIGCQAWAFGTQSVFSIWYRKLDICKLWQQQQVLVAELIDRLAAFCEAWIYFSQHGELGIITCSTIHHSMYSLVFSTDFLLLASAPEEDVLRGEISV